MTKYLKMKPETEGSFQKEELLEIKPKDWRDSIEFYSSTHRNATDFIWCASQYDLNTNVIKMALQMNKEKRKWEISFDGWYPYCPVCKQEPTFRGPICLKCGTILEPDPDDMKTMQDENPILYQAIIEYVERRLENQDGT